MTTVGASLLAPMVSYGGFPVSPAWTNAPVYSYAAPCGVNHWCVRRPDGALWSLEYHPFDMWQFRGEYPWVGELAGRYARLCADPREPVGERTVLFRDGKLLYARASGREYDFKFDEEGPRGAPMESLWPDAAKSPGRIRADIWGSDRLRLWFDNPNCAAVLFAQVALAALAALLFLGAAWRVHAAVWFAAGFVALVQSSSRGGFIGFLGGAAVLGAAGAARGAARRAFASRRVRAASALAAACMAAYVAFVAGGRFGSGIVSQDSVTDRLALWREVPHMMADAPDGWGFGNSGRAYMEWYGDLPRSHTVRSLISTHLTWLVEMGNAGRVTYVFLWVLALALFAESAACGRSALPLAIGVAFFASAVFNHVGESPALWAAPALSLAAYAAGRPWRRARSVCAWASVAVIAASLAVASGSLLCRPSAVDRRGGHFAVRRSGPAVIMNGGTPSTWVVDDVCSGYALSGGYFTGREVRTFFSQVSDLMPLGVVRSVEDLPRDAEKVAVGGMSCADYIRLWKAGGVARPPKRLLLVSPPFPPSEVPGDLLAASEVKMVAGEFAARYWPRGEAKPPWVEIEKRAELYIPDWMERVAWL